MSTRFVTVFWMVLLLIAVFFVSKSYATTTTVASQLTGRPGTVVVSDMSAPRQQDDYGYADVAGNIIHMQPWIVSFLNRIEMHDRTLAPSSAALAVFVLCHEARHIRDLTLIDRESTPEDEEIADKWAKYNAYSTARHLGASKAQADKMRKWINYWYKRWA